MTVAPKFINSPRKKKLYSSKLDSNKKAFTPSRQGFLHDFGSLDTVFGSTDLSATLFDDWFSGDLQQAGFLSQQQQQENDSSSSSSLSDSDNSHSPVLSEEDSPALGFDSITSDADLIHSPGFDSSTMGFFPDIPTNSTPARLFGNTTPPVAPMMPLTAESVQQAAAALNIPWSKGLEEAVMAQSLLASFPMALAMPVAPPTPVAPVAPVAPLAPALLARTTSLPPLMPKQGASMTVAHMPDTAMDSPPSTPAPMSPVSPMTSSLALADLRSLSILSSKQTSLPVVAANGAAIKATTYKSTYRSASLLKRDREFDEPPSVLEGKDVSGMDEVSLKRAKNTDAARRSRRKKLIKMESLEQRVAELEVENSMFETKLNEVELERSLLADKDQMQQARIQELEGILSSLREKMY